jgi:PilZ domain
MESPNAERRRSPRHQLILDLFFDGAEGVGIAQTRDINIQGLYFNSLTIIPKGSHLKLRLPVNSTQEFIVLDAEVVYSQPKIGCAVEFSDLTPEAEKILAAFIEEVKESQMMTSWENMRAAA